MPLAPIRFQPEPPLVEGAVHAHCRAIVTVPARNEESVLESSLDALAVQCDLSGKPLEPGTFEVLLLLNNCSDASAAVAARWQAAHPEICLHVVERDLSQQHAHIGMARRLLMDTAWSRLASQRSRRQTAILTTDADSVVAPDWIAQNLLAIDDGADAVGGNIHLKDGELARLPDGARQAYQDDHRYQHLVAELEDLLDPQPGDPWPRHLQHFGASLACTPAIYAHAGGMPQVERLEDIAFVDALRRVEARLRHAPEVHVYTSARMDGRATIGLSSQLELWQQLNERGEQHSVQSAAWLVHRFCSLRRLRHFCSHKSQSDAMFAPVSWRPRLAEVRKMQLSPPLFLAELDCDRLIEETFAGQRESPIGGAIADLRDAIEWSARYDSKYAGSHASTQDDRPV